MVGHGLNISKMKAPGDTRPTWMNGIIQIHITRACDLACTGCTQGSNLAGKPVIMSLENFERAVESLRDYYGVVGIFGGNPTLHPRFADVCSILSRQIPFERRGLWSNFLGKHAEICRATFNPGVSNINVHANALVYKDILEKWPELAKYQGPNLKGLKDSRHSPPYVAMKDMEDMSNEERFRLIENCDINQLWSAIICQFRGNLRGFFCELAGAQSMLHESEPDYPDTGVPIINGWWKAPIHSFAEQISKHCLECGIPLRGAGDFGNGTNEYVSKTHLNVYKLKKPQGKTLHVVTNRDQLNGNVGRVTDYIQNGMVNMRGNIKVMIGVPTMEYARRADFYDYLSIIQKPEGTMECKPHGQSPARNRNLIVEQALANNCTHILFVDDDMILPPDALLKMLAHNVDCVTGLYVMRNYPHKPVAFTEMFMNGLHSWVTLDEAIHPDKLVEIKNAGMGCALIKTDVFKGWNKPFTLGEIHQDEWDDDIVFWIKVRERGHKLYLDPSIQCGHIASVVLKPTYSEGKWFTEYHTSGTANPLVPQHIPTEAERAATRAHLEKIASEEDVTKRFAPQLERANARAY